MFDRARRGRRRLAPWAAAALLAPALPACQATVQTSKRPGPPKVEEAPPKSAETPRPPRWVESGPTLEGPKLAEGTLVLLGGRRVLVAPDGKAIAETQPLPEPLVHVAVVVSTKGKRIVVAHTRRAVYRLDTPLGEPKKLVEPGDEIRSIGMLPGAVAVWTAGAEEPRIVSVEDGPPPAGPEPLALPCRRMAFVSAMNGACQFEAAGLHTTTDGGKTWAPIEAPVFSDLRVEDEKGVLLHPRYGGARQIIEFGPWGERLREPPSRDEGPRGGESLEGGGSGAERESESPVLRWVQRTRKDPLMVAVDKGVLLPSGEALVVSNGLLARVDLTSGLVVQADDLGEDTRDWEHASVVRAGETLWLVRPLPAADPDDAAFGLHEVVRGASGFAPAASPSLRIKAPYYGGPTVVSAPSGALMTEGSCDPAGNKNAVCVRQPDGRWRTLYPKIAADAAPLADGRIAYLRGLSSVDEPPPDLAPRRDPKARDASPGAEEKRPPGERTSYVVTLDSCGVEETVGVLQWPSAEPVEITALGRIQEDAEGRLHVLLQPEHGDPTVFVVTPGQGPSAGKVERYPVTGAALAKLSGDHGAAADMPDGGLRITADGGLTWRRVTLPLGQKEWAAALREHVVETPWRESPLRVGDVGLRARSLLRIGWGPPGAPADESGGEGGGAASGQEAEAPRAPSIVCSNGAVTDGAALLDIRQSFGRFESMAARAREVLPLGGGGTSSLVVAAMAVERPKENAGKQAKATLVWMDFGELGAAPRELTTAASLLPRDVHLISGDAASGARAVLRLWARDYDHPWPFLARTTASGLVVTPTDRETRPAGHVTMGATDRDPVAWVGGVAVDWNIVVWRPGEEPWIVASLDFDPDDDDAAEVLVGLPHHGKLQVLLLSRTWAATKTLDIPAKRPERAPNIGLGGWTRVDFGRGSLEQLPSCSKTSAGHRYRVGATPAAPIEIDGRRLPVKRALYDLQVEGKSACVAAAALVLSVDPWRGLPRDVVRHDIVAKRAERATTESRAPVRSLACERRIGSK